MIIIKKFNSTKYKNDFAKEKYDSLRIQVPKGQKEKIKECAKSKNMSLNAFVNHCIKAEMEKDTK